MGYYNVTLLFLWGASILSAFWGANYEPYLAAAFVVIYIENKFDKKGG